MPSIEQILQYAIQCHQAGNMPEAEKAYEQILAHEPNHDVALHLLGLLNGQLKRPERAIELMRRSIELQPDNPKFHSNIANAFIEHGDFDAASAFASRALVLSPNYAEAHFNLGTAQYRLKKLDDAIESFRRAVACKPNFALALRNLGIALADRGALDEAIAYYQQALLLTPNDAETLGSYGMALYRKDRFAEAVETCRRAIAIKPDYIDALNNLGSALCRLGQFDEGLDCYRRVLALDPDYVLAAVNLGQALCDSNRDAEAVAHGEQLIARKPDVPQFQNILGLAYFRVGRNEDAIACYQRALALKPDFTDALGNLGSPLHDMGRFDEAIGCFDRYLAVKPDNAAAHFNRSFAILIQGDLKRGFAEFEWRWKCDNLAVKPRNCPQPRWDGSPLNGRTILLHHEQGYGDTLQFIRYIERVEAMGGVIIVETPVQLSRLLPRAFGGKHTWVGGGEAIPHFDVHCPMMSLPFTFGTTLETIPPPAPLLSADPATVNKWKTLVGPDDGSLRIGIAWAGNKEHKNDRNRSMPLRTLAPLGQIPGVRFFSLQVGDRASEAKDPSSGLRLLDRSADLTDFAETAGLIANLDLVISVDTVVVHLAGAMGKPVWTLLPFVPDWRWLMKRDDTPWYPSMKLFRQPKRGDWASVMQNVANSLRPLVEQQRHKS